jgi:DNA-binding transcriptional LysR family regulator
MIMNIEFYQEFIIVAETRNFWEASERLFMNQSTLSKHIKCLEDELGAPLFVRTTRHVELTEYGKTLLPYALELVRTYNDSNAALLKTRNRLNGQITVGSIPDMDSYGITNVFHSFLQEYPQYSIKPTEDDPCNLLTLLRERKCDFVFTRESRLDFEHYFKDDEEISRIPYLTDFMVAAVSKKHPLATKKELHLRELKDEAFCLLKENSMLYRFITNLCAEAGFTPNVVFTSQRLGNIFDMVSRGNGISLLMNYHTMIPTDSPDVLSSLGYVAIPIMPAIRTQVSLCRLNGSELTPAARDFYSFCEKALITQNFTDTKF